LPSATASSSLPYGRRHEAVAVGAPSAVMERPSRFRRNNLARCTRVFTAGPLSPRAYADVTVSAPWPSGRSSFH